MKQIPSGLPEEKLWPQHMLIARAEVGVRERPGGEDNPRILEYLRSTRLPDKRIHDSTSWCTAFTSWCLEQAGLKSPGYAMARRWLQYGLPLTEPTFGCIAVFSRPPDENSGHVGFYADAIGDDIMLLGGNQRNAVNFACYPKERLLGYRMPVKK